MNYDAIQGPKLIRIRAKGFFKWFKKDRFILEYSHLRLTGEWSDQIIIGCLMAGDRPIYSEE